MLFNSFQYWIFFVIVAALFYSMPFRTGKLLLLCASYVFYMWWDPRFIVLILTSTVVDYFLGIWLEVTSGVRKKLLLAVSLIVNLGLLGFFKYYDFFAGSLAGLLHVPKSSVVLQIVLPVGISFYTFASLSYTFDVYWGKMKAVRNFADYALFRHPTRSRVLINIGGIANLTFLPAGGSIDDVVAFDTGPGNCISDALVRRHDPGGRGRLPRLGEIATGE